MPRNKSKSKLRNRNTRKRATNNALNASETKLQKHIVDLSESAYQIPLNINFWSTPYQVSFVNPAVFLNPTTDIAGNPPIALGSFIRNGNNRDERNGRRITMMSSTIDLVFHLKSREVGGVYSYVQNPEFRIVQGYAKQGLTGLADIPVDIHDLYSEISYAKYMIMKDYILTRTGTAAMVGSDGTGGYINPATVLSYKSIKLNFRWTPKRKITFDDSSTVATPNQNTVYAGWVPFFIIINPHPTLDVIFDNIKRLNAFKDL